MDAYLKNIDSLRVQRCRLLGLRRKYSDKVLKCSNVCKGKAREDHKIDPLINIELQTADKLSTRQAKRERRKAVRVFENSN